MYISDGSFDFQILYLTHPFFVDYSNPLYKEIVRKDNRPYNCLLLQSHYGYFICIPYRSHINHIKNDAQSYIDNYGNYQKGQKLNCNEKEFQRIYQYSTLKYFHKELGLN